MPGLPSFLSTTMPRHCFISIPSFGAVNSSTLWMRSELAKWLRNAPVLFTTNDPQSSWARTPETLCCGPRAFGNDKDETNVGRASNTSLDTRICCHASEDQVKPSVSQQMFQRCAHEKLPVCFFRTKSPLVGADILLSPNHAFLQPCMSLLGEVTHLPLARTCPV